LADRRTEYFEAGILVIWDVDPKAKTITMYRAAAPPEAILFRSGQIADAEPAVPGWHIAVEDVFNA
jgi:Uma2 family endonuclease